MCFARGYLINIIKTKIHSSYEIEYFCRNSSLQAVRDTPIARITGCVSSSRALVGDSPYIRNIEIQSGCLMEDFVDIMVALPSVL